MPSVCIAEMHITLNNIKILHVAQTCFYGEFVASINKKHLGLHVKYPIFLSDFKHIWIFTTDFQKKFPISSFMEIRLVQVVLINEDRRRHMPQLTSAFRMTNKRFSQN